ncbi:chaperone protein dnaJ 11, chloroplastic-like [Impatiens glandulifera]|uniref:chaperone protein dnaJ 11, chloroplastic-like n=1 Tax=Impatiens glandulifera TaxID=253017 RepID=UPI001FB10BD2|nr:chaperone protein dnaJ 11, chloroplastic-like [Impatiens glandulifera]
MVSSTFLPSTQFLSSNPRLSVQRTSQSPTTTVNFRRTHLISASCATVERSSVSSPSSSLYEVLGIQSGATCQEIKTAYRRLARVVHPDVTAADGGGRTADEFIKIHTAYSTLSDPEKRAVYDGSLFLDRMRGFSVGSYGGSVQTTAASRFSGGGAPRRNWETDQCW